MPRFVHWAVCTKHLLIVWLMFFGMRKRRYMNNIGTLRGWLSAHIYLGTSLILVVLVDPLNVSERARKY